MNVSGHIHDLRAGGEQEGRSREQYRTYEVRSMELRRVGAAVMWDGKHLFVCARKAELRDGMPAA